VPGPGPITVLLADDHPVFLEAVAEAVREHPGLDLVGAASDGEEAMAGLATLRPDVAMLDMRLPRLSGQEILERAASRRLEPRIVFLSAHTDDEVVYRALAHGAAGYLSKDVDREAICDAAIAVAQGEIVVSAGMRDRLAGPGRGGVAARLTGEERAVLSLAAEGRSTREIAVRLDVLASTVRAELESVCTKLGAHDRTSAVAAALRRGLLA
jgi:two-component system nitrate/nitrite response regulator NarL